jgi:hypothetical protein
LREPSLKGDLKATIAILQPVRASIDRVQADFATLSDLAGEYLELYSRFRTWETPLPSFCSREDFQLIVEKRLWNRGATKPADIVFNDVIVRIESLTLFQSDPSLPLYAESLVCARCDRYVLKAFAAIIDPTVHIPQELWAEVELGAKAYLRQAVESAYNPDGLHPAVMPSAEREFERWLATREPYVLFLGATLFLHAGPKF